MSMLPSFLRAGMLASKQTLTVMSYAVKSSIPALRTSIEMQAPRMMSKLRQIGTIAGSNYYHPYGSSSPHGKAIFYGSLLVGACWMTKRAKKKRLAKNAYKEDIKRLTRETQTLKDLVETLVKKVDLNPVRPVFNSEPVPVCLPPVFNQQQNYDNPGISMKADGERELCEEEDLTKRLDERADQIATGFNKYTPIAKFIGWTMQFTPDHTPVCHLPYRPELNHALGSTHGGMYMSMLDNVMWASAAVHHPPHTWLCTGEMSIHFLRPATNTGLTAYGRVIKRGTRQDIGSSKVIQ